MTLSRTRLTGTGGVLALALAVFGGLVLDPTVRRLPVRARLSDLGRPGAPGAPLFGLGLLLAGLLGLAFARGCWRGADDPLGRAVAALAGAAALGFAGAGLFPEPGLAHAPLLATAYLAAWSTVLLDGVCRGEEGGDGARAGTVLVASAVVVAFLWVVRALVAATFLLSGPTSALLLPELATLATFGGWVLFRAHDGGAAADAGVTDAEP